MQPVCSCDAALRGEPLLELGDHQLHAAADAAQRVRALDAAQPHDQVLGRVGILGDEMVVAAPVANPQHRQMAQDFAEQIPEAHVAQIDAVDLDVTPDVVVVLVLEGENPVAQLALPVAASHRAAAEKPAPVSGGLATVRGRNLLILFGDELADPADRQQQQIEERALLGFLAVQRELGLERLLGGVGGKGRQVVVGLLRRARLDDAEVVEKILEQRLIARLDAHRAELGPEVLTRARLGVTAFVVRMLDRPHAERLRRETDRPRFDAATETAGGLVEVDRHRLERGRVNRRRRRRCSGVSQR